ncbi:MAG: hypothetical protein K6G07_00870 [Lachnospiraceae bacterium]|nr:hypothetical protein [Lachnospiraceae bacterium]
MKSDVITVTGSGEGLREALAQAEAVADFKKVSPKEKMHLRLLSEEMLGLLRALTGDYRADYWIEDKDGVFELHLRVETLVNTELRRKLMSVSSSGKNIAAKGVMGKIREVFACALEPASANPYDVVSKGLILLNDNMVDMNVNYVWSLNHYVDTIKSDDTITPETWDELEKSIVAKLSDDVQISILENVVEMIILKSMKQTDE